MRIEIDFDKKNIFLIGKCNISELIDKIKDLKLYGPEWTIESTPTDTRDNYKPTQDFVDLPYKITCWVNNQ